MNTRTRQLAAILLVGLLTASAGCSTGLLTSSGPQATISDASVELTDDGPAIAFQYNTTQYTTALLEGPQGDILAEHELSPNQSRARLGFDTPRGGNYTVVLKQDNATAVTETLEFQGAQPEIVGVETSWQGNQLANLSFELRNTGDLPARMDGVSYSAAGEPREYSGVRWLEANETKTYTVATSEYNRITVTEPGTVEGDFTVYTGTRGRLSTGFTKSLDPANLEIRNVTESWSGNSLEDVTVTVVNTGDIPESAEAVIKDGDAVLATAYEQGIPPNESATFELWQIGGIYDASAGEDVSLRLGIEGESDTASETITREGASLTINSMTPIWDDGTLSAVEFSVSNSGTLDAIFAANVSIDGHGLKSVERSIEAGATEEFTIGSKTSDRDNVGMLFRGGTYSVTLSVDGASTSDSVSESVSFNGPDAQVEFVDPAFYDNYDSNTSTLNSARIQLSNHGDLPFWYTAVELSIAGKTVTQDTVLNGEIQPGETGRADMGVLVDVPNGQHEMTVRFLRDGETVLSHTTTVSTD